MKELSIEGKAKRYDEALERAKIWKDKSGMPKDRQGILDDIFPELAESEDEKIRKSITEFFKNYSKNGTWKAIPDVTKWIAWLEKQEQKPNNVYDKELSEILGSVICRYINDPNISYTEREKVSMEIIPYMERLEKQGEQQHTIFIPKFRIGDIVKSISQPMLEPRKIISIGKDYYWCEDKGCIGFAWEDDYELVEQKPVWSEEQIKEGLEEAASDWGIKASVSPISMIMDSGRPIGTQKHTTSHQDSFKKGAEWVINKLKAL